MRVERSVYIDAPPERVFERWAEPDAVPAWQATIRSIEHDGPLDHVGARFRIHWARRFEATDLEIVGYEPPALHESAAGGGRRYRVTARFEPEDGGTAMRLELCMPVPLVLAPLLRLRLSGELAGVLEPFRAFAETG